MTSHGSHLGGYGSRLPSLQGSSELLLAVVLLHWLPSTAMLPSHVCTAVLFCNEENIMISVL